GLRRRPRRGSPELVGPRRSLPGIRPGDHAAHRDLHSGSWKGNARRSRGGPSLNAGVVVTIHQPERLPWLGFFDKIRQADVFVMLDHVQYRKRYFQNRNRIRAEHGAIWLTVPVHV